MSDINDRVLHSTVKLDSIAYMLMQLGHAQHKGVLDTLDPDVLYGISYMLEDVSNTLKPVIDAPSEIGRWTPEQDGAR